MAACSSVKVTSTAALTSRSPGSIGIGSAAVAALAWSPALRINSPEDSAPGSVSLIRRPTLRPDPVAERSPPAARVIELLVDGVADLAHQPLRCTTSSKGRRFKRVPGLSGRSAG